MQTVLILVAVTMKRQSVFHFTNTESKQENITDEWVNELCEQFYRSGFTDPSESISNLISYTWLNCVVIYWQFAMFWMQKKAFFSYRKKLQKMDKTDINFRSNWQRFGVHCSRKHLWGLYIPSTAVFRTIVHGIYLLKATVTGQERNRITVGTYFST